MKKLLILGSDFSTVHLVCEAKKMGVYVIVSDLMQHSPSKDYADESWNISTTDIELLATKITEKKIDGVMAGASEFNLENARHICKRLNLPLYCESDNAWSIARDKRKFKDLCIKNSVRVAKDYYLSDKLYDEEFANISFPVVVKPTDKSGNRGMSYCNNIDELIDGYHRARDESDAEKIIVETQLKGPEYTGYYVIANGEIVLSYYTSMHHQTGYPDNFYSLEYLTSRHLKQYLAEMNDGIISVLKEAGCTNGIAWVETMYNQDGHFYALEMGYRFAGPGVYAVHERVSGFNTYRWMIECALGIRHKVSDLPKPLKSGYVECAGAYNFFTKREGEIAEICGLDRIEKLPNVVVDMPKRKGSSVRKNVNMGIIKIFGKDCDEMCETINFINKNLKILNDEKQNMFIYFNDFKKVKDEYEEGLKEFTTT